MNKPFRLAAVIMRAQLPTLAHFALIEQAHQKADHVIVLLGSSNLAPSFRNPFSFEQRRAMIQSGLGSYKTMTTHFAPLPDFPTDFEWEAEALKQISRTRRALNVTKDSDVTLIAHEKDETSYYVHSFPQFKLNLVPSFGDINATDARIILVENESLTLELLRPKLETMTKPSVVTWLFDNYLCRHANDPFGFNWLVKERAAELAFKETYSGLPYGINFITGDALVICGSHILLVQRGGRIGHNQWALPGGFKEPGENIKTTIERELAEETVIDVPTRALRLAYRGCDKFDEQGRDPRGDFTTFCGVFVIEPNRDGSLPKVRGTSDAKQAIWKHVAEVREMSKYLFADHAKIIETQMRRYV